MRIQKHTTAANLVRPLPLCECYLITHMGPITHTYTLGGYPAGGWAGYPGAGCGG